MIADEPLLTPAVGTPAADVLAADAFHQEIVAFIQRELPVWRDRPTRPQLTDEPNLNQTLCLHLNSASRRQCFDSVQFVQEPIQSTGRRADVGVMPLGTIIVEGRSYEDFDQLLPIECKRLPTPPDRRRSDFEYIHGLPGHRTGAIERFKHGLHGSANQRALIIAYVQSEPFAHWQATINERLDELASMGVDQGLWSPSERLSLVDAAHNGELHKLISRHRRLQPLCSSDLVELEHLWLQMN